MILKSIFNFIIYFSREVEFSEGEKIKNNYDVDFFMETSAKDGFNTEELFFQTTKIVYENYLDEIKSSPVIFFFFILFLFRLLIMN